MQSAATCPVGEHAVTFRGTLKSNPHLPPIDMVHCSADDRVTADDMRQVRERMVAKYADSGVTADMISVSRQSTDPSMHAVLSRNMSRSCAPSFDVSDANQVQSFTCYYHGPYVEDDGTTRSVRLRREGRLASCDATEAQRRQTEDDVRMLGHYRMGGDERGIEVDRVYCDIMTMPTTN